MFMNGHPYRELVLFSEARGLPPSRRVAYLDKACLGNAALRQRVEELIQADEQAGNFLHDPAPGAHWPLRPSFGPKGA